MEEGVRHDDRKPWSLRRPATITALILGFLCAGEAVRAADASAPGSAGLPESMSAAAIGTVYFRSFAGFHVAGGAAEAKASAQDGANGLSSALGAVADPASDMLDACSDRARRRGGAVSSGDQATALKLFVPTTGEPKAGLMLGNGKPCGRTASRDEVIFVSDETAHVADSGSRALLRLGEGNATGGPRSEVKGAPPDSLAILDDGDADAGAFEGDELYRLATNPEAVAGAAAKLQAWLPLRLMGRLNAFNSNKLVMVGSETEGLPDPIAVSGDNAKIDTVRSGIEGPVSPWRVGAVSLIDAPLKSMFDPN